MADTKGEEGDLPVSTTATKGKKDEIIPPTTKTLPKITAGNKMVMPPVIDWSNNSMAGTSDTTVTFSSKSNIPVGHCLSNTSAGGSPMDIRHADSKMPYIPYMPPPTAQGLQFMQSPNPVYGGYQPYSPPPYGFPLPYHHSFPPQMNFAQPSFEAEEEQEEDTGSLNAPDPQLESQEGEGEDEGAPLPVSLIAAKVAKKSVQSALVGRISDGLYQTDAAALKNLRELAVDKCALPSNLTHPIPKLESKLIPYLTPEGVKADTAMATTQEGIWMLLQPVIRAFEKVRGSASTSAATKENLMYLMQISIQGFCALITDWSRRRRIAIRKDSLGHIDFRALSDSDIPAESETLFGGLFNQVSFGQKRIKGKILKLALKRKGLSDRVIETISKSKRDVTSIQYDRVMDRYYAWCKTEEREPFGDDISTPLEFMQFLMDENIKPTHGKEKRGYSCLRIATSALSALLSFEGIPFGQHHLSKAFMKGVLNERPITHRYQVQWDAQRVINKLKNPPFTPAFRIPLLLLAKKTLFLILMATSRRVHISKALCISREKCTRTKSRVLFHIERKDLKQGGAMKKKPAPLEVKAYPENKGVDPVLYIEEYIKRTAPIRGDIPQLFLTTKGPVRPISKDTARNWVKDILEKCGVNTNQFGPGSTRGASSSTASALGASLEEILKAGEWSSASVWQTYYHKPIVKNNSTVADVLLS